MAPQPHNDRPRPYAFRHGPPGRRLAATWQLCHGCQQLVSHASPCTCRHRDLPGPALAVWPLLVALLVVCVGAACLGFWWGLR